MNKTRLATVFGLTMLGLLLSSPVGNPVRGDTSLAPDPRPNIVYIVSDDQRFDSLWTMPTVQAQLQAKGVTLTNFVGVSQPCCPSRSTVLTGLYAHSHHVYNNGNGWDTYVKRGWEQDSLPLWLQAAHYKTGFVGKYLNGYNDVSHVPPGWNRWVAATGYEGGGNGDGDYYTYLLSVDGTPMQYGHHRSDYSTDVLGDYATSFIHSEAGPDPFFLYFAPHPPHLPAIPYHGDRDTYKNYKYRGRAYDEADVSDKPQWVQDNPRFGGTPTEVKRDRLNRVELATLTDLDRVVGRIIQALSDENELSNTMIVFTTDNGFMWGEHRLFEKGKPYVESILLPFVVRWDGHLPANTTVGEVAGTVDLTKTWVDLAQATPGHTLEGVDMMPLLTTGATLHPAGILTEAGNGTIPSYCELYAPTFAYTLYGDKLGEEEYYDLVKDPFELQNAISDPNYASQIASARVTLNTLCQPRPPGWHDAASEVGPARTGD